MTRNYLQQQKPLQDGDNTYWTPQKHLKSRQIMKISNISESHTNLMDDKQDSI